jgi:multiple sugar transport system permease protein
MSHIPVVGRRSLRVRLLIGALYAVLTIGAVTMIYPFLIMLATSVKSGVDSNDYQVVPKYLYDPAALFAKYAETKYAGNMDQINDYYGGDFLKLENIRPPQTGPLTPGESALVRDWNEFRATLPTRYRQANFGPLALVKAPSSLEDRYRAFLETRFHGDIALLNKTYLEENASFDTVMSPFERPTNREWQPDNSAKMRDWLKFEAALPPDFTCTVGCDPMFASFLKQDKYAGDISKLNMVYGTSYKSFSDVHFAPKMPANPAARADWEEFARRVLPFRYMSLSAEAGSAYRRFLTSRYSGRLAAFNHVYGTSYASFDQVALPKIAPLEGAPLTDWMDFIATSIPITAIHPINSENLFRKWALRKYGSYAEVNRAYGVNRSDQTRQTSQTGRTKGTSLAYISQLTPPYALADWQYVLSNTGSLREHFLTRNYGMVISYILLHGRAVLNTFIFCLAVVLAHLIVNPLCAYALSRYNLPYAYKILLFLLATMAFPAEVAMIPNFLLLKQLNMLNTFWALVLPGMASGFSIFLLKGFFDSLPKELYEAAIIDGASEPRMFWSITTPLSKPIFAVIALQAFTAAYGAFMFAFLVCQDPKMWTMMVWLYELQISAPKYVTMAALTVAALPTLIIFIFAQKVIMRGIILPSFK